MGTDGGGQTSRGGEYTLAFGMGMRQEKKTCNCNEKKEAFRGQFATKVGNPFYWQAYLNTQVGMVVRAEKR